MQKNSRSLPTPIGGWHSKQSESQFHLHQQIQQGQCLKEIIYQGLDLQILLLGGESSKAEELAAKSFSKITAILH